MTTWTLALDESGRFEGNVIPGEKAERRGFVVGGVLFPKAADEVATQWRDGLSGVCRTVGTHYPPHSNALGPGQTDLLRAQATSHLNNVGGFWLFVVDEPDANSTQAKSLSRYVRMLGETVDLAARFVALHGGRRLDVLPAQRTVPLDEQLEREARVAGRIVEAEDGSSRLRALSEVEVRNTLDAVGRGDVGWSHPYPSVGNIDVRSAESGAVHAAVAFADLGCNHIWRAMSSGRTMAAVVGELGGADRVVLAARVDTRRLRQIDRALRDTPPDLVRGARYVAELAVPESVAGWQDVVRSETARSAERLWDLGLTALVPRVQKDRRWSALARALAGQAEAILAVKGGAYEGLWRALREAWTSDSELAQGCRAGASDELVAQLWRLTLECANHRGDTESALRAATAAHDVFAHARSFRLLAERQQVDNLVVVQLQNELPTEDARVEDIRSELDRRTAQLLKSADDAGALVDMAFGEAPAREASAELDPSELALWRTDGDREPAFVVPDIERGRLYGTAARSYAFLGELDRAFELGMQARSLFAGSSFDLAFNASVLARIELERARLGDARVDRLTALLTLAGVDGVRKPSRLHEALGRGDFGARFAFDTLLRALLWAPTATSIATATWVQALADDKLYDALSTGETRSHPTELIARHAGELLLAHGEARPGRRWLELSVELCDANAPGTTLHRLGHLSRLLLEEGTPTGAPGSLSNPTFEYR